MKRIILCGDGTWNEPNQTDQKIASPTNVVKIATSVSPFDTRGRAQLVCYHAGVGVEKGYFNKVTGGVLGTGISRNIQDLYLFLVLNYTPGDEVFLFGFSRGSYTVRSLAGLIRNCGILKDTNVNKFQEAYQLYRSRTDNSHPNAIGSITFREKYSWPDFNIKFIGVWDTVGALGIPIPYIGKKFWEFHDVELNSYVDYAYQALAIDEHRKYFAPCIWTKQANSPTSQILEQAWFPGSHCNVGGGYKDTGLSDCALDWIWQKAVGCGLAMDEQRNVSPNPAGILRLSVKMGYRLLGVHMRAIGTKLPHSYEQLSDAALQRKSLIPDYEPKNMLEFMHKNTYTYLHKDKEKSMELS
ncbi:MAG: DUF2235 domain-containing protein [Legionella sp.]|nr:DUF2235 domain-containing protein [Legionella sp.]